MAKVELGWDEINDEALPFVCLKCGRPAKLWMTKRFDWQSSGRGGLNLLGFILFGALYAGAGAAGHKTYTVKVPLCKAHKNHWRWRAVFIWGVGLTVLASFFIGLAGMESNRNRPGGLWGYFFGAGFLGLLLWLPMTFVLILTSIRPTYISDDSITLKGVAKGFRERLKALRKAEEESEEGGKAGVGGAYQVVGTPVKGGPRRVIASFGTREKAEKYEAFLQTAGTYKGTSIEEPAPAEEQEEQGHLVRNIVLGVLSFCLLVAGSLGLRWLTTTPAPRPPIAAPAPVPVAKGPSSRNVPDFSQVDYALEKVDYSKGPQNQAVFARTLPYRIGQQSSTQVLHGYVDLPGDVRTIGTGLLGLGAAPSWPAACTTAALSAACRFVAHGKQTAMFPGGAGGAEPQRFLEAYFRSGKFHGPYTEWLASGKVKVQGFFKDGKKHGLRTTWDADGNKQGEEHYLDATLHGTTRLWYTNGKQLAEGAWDMGQRQGPWKKWDPAGAEETVYWARGAFDHGSSTQSALVWAMQLVASGRNNNGNLVYQDGSKFHEAFGKPNHKVPQPTLQGSGWQEWLYNCTDGIHSIRFEAVNEACVVRP